MARLLLVCSVAIWAGADGLAPSWEEFKEQYDGERVFERKGILQASVKLDDNDIDSEARRKRAYEANVAYIDKRNGEQSSFQLGVNHLADLDREAYAKLVLSKVSQSEAHHKQVVRVDVSDPPPSSVDWREKNAVTPVKNQGQCGSCWAFSAVGAIEGAYAISTGSLRSLSEQELVDCATENHGCGGGNLDLAMKFVVGNHGLDDESDYPYTGTQSPCDTTREKRIGARIANWTDVEPKNEAQMIAYVAKGPVAVAIEADQTDFQLYKSGVFDAACGEKLDHGVLVVGYTEDSFIVKNSWGESWGDKGFIRLKRFPADTHPAGQCGLLSFPVAAVVADSTPVPVSPPSPPSPSPSLKCECTSACNTMCLQFGMQCCSGKGGNCNCQPAIPGCCDSGLRSFLVPIDKLD